MKKFLQKNNPLFIILLLGLAMHEFFGFDSFVYFTFIIAAMSYHNAFTGLETIKKVIFPDLDKIDKKLK